MNAVRTNNGIRDRLFTAGKAEANAPLSLIQSNQLVAELYAVAGNSAGQSGMQIAPMSQQIGGAKFPFRYLAENHVEFDFAGSPIPIVPGAWIEGLLAQSRLESNLTQNLHGIAADLNSRTKSCELRGLLIHRDVDAHPPQRRRRSEAAHAGANDRNR